MQTKILSESEGDPCPVLPPVWQRLANSSVKFPDRLAVASLYQPPALYGIDTDHEGKTYLSWSYKELSFAVDRLARSLERLGARPGKALATFLYNGVEFVIPYWAAHKLGCRFVPMNPRTLINFEEAAHMLRVGGVSIILVQDCQIASNFDALSKGMDLVVGTKILASEGLHETSWLHFADLLRPDDGSDRTTNGDVDEPLKDDIATILFTSGTTSLPKGVPHTDSTLNAFCENLSLGGRSENSVFCSVLPNNHAMGYFYILHFHCHGAAVVYPSPSFDPKAMLKALEEEKCTHTALVPTTLHALLETLKTRGTSLNSSLTDVCLAGSSITPENMRQVINELGSQGVSTGFGMTEGSPIWSAPKKNPEELINGDLTVVGSASRGVRIRICEPDSRTPVPRGQRGEIHQSGPGLVKSYLGVDVGCDKFYTDEENRTWFVTGDQGVMLENGLVSVTGRYKDMIIRGGENIAPAAIETVLNKIEGVQAQVVGAPDPIAGEVPVAVVHDLANTSIKALQNAVLQHMGSTFVPDEIVTLEDIGLEDFPKTVSGKVQKSQLEKIVQAFRKQRSTEANSAISKRQIRDTVIRIWYKSSGIPKESLDLQAPTTNFADSISFMRVRDSLRKELGCTLSLEEMVDNPNIESQIKLLEKRVGEGKKQTKLSIKHVGPPTLDQMSSMFGSLDQAEKMKELVTKTVGKDGFNWSDDVAAIIPAHDYMQVLLESELINSWNFAIAVMADGSSTQQLRGALEKVLANNPILVSFYVLDQYRNPHYVTLKPNSKLWDMCILDHGSVKSSADVQQVAIRYPYPEHATAPGPLFRCLIIHVEETQSAAMVMYVHHIVQDVSVMRLVNEDLEQALSYPSKELRLHVDYRAWADSYQALRYSPAATVSVNYHVNRLADLHLHQKAIYPPALVPRRATEEDPDGLDFGFDAPGLLDLKKSHPTIIAAVVLKTAMALVNVNRTGYSHALFNNFEAVRTRFPFIPASLEALNPEAFEAADVSGPVMEGVCNLVEVRRNETAISLLERMQAEQAELTKHAHAPLRRVISALNTNGSGAGDMMIEAHRAHFLTWIPGFLGEYERIRVAQIAIRCVAGLVVVAGLGGPNATTYIFSMRWDVANYSREKTALFVEDLKQAILWLTAKERWNTPVSAFLDGLEKFQAEKTMWKDSGRRRAVSTAKHSAAERYVK